MKSEPVSKFNERTTELAMKTIKNNNNKRSTANQCSTFYNTNKCMQLKTFSFRFAFAFLIRAWERARMNYKDTNPDVYRLKLNLIHISKLILVYLRFL